jgi:hypothetical protein
MDNGVNNFGGLVWVMVHCAAAEYAKQEVPEGHVCLRRLFFFFSMPTQAHVFSCRQSKKL